MRLVPWRPTFAHRREGCRNRAAFADWGRRDELQKLGFVVSERSVPRYLRRMHSTPHSRYSGTNPKQREETISETDSHPSIMSN